tara:strand:- start:503 stop:835 length:333 start_codon:yes stop_codon:yes gene_type:complete
MGGGLRDSDKTTVVVKFYSNGCHFCHALSEYYLDISEEEKYEGVYFFAHNVDDDGIIAEKLKLNGVPSIVLFQTQDGRCTKTRVLADPDKPHDKTWFTVKQIKTFINREI